MRTRWKNAGHWTKKKQPQPRHERKRDMRVVIRAQERNAGAMGHSPIAGGGNPPNGVAARHSVPSRFSPKKTGNGRSLRAHWRENLYILVAIASSRLCESARCSSSEFCSRFSIVGRSLAGITVPWHFSSCAHIVSRICDSDFFFMYKESSGEIVTDIDKCTAELSIFRFGCPDYYQRGWECKV